MIFSRSQVWWVQPGPRNPDTAIAPDGTWKNSTHLGTDYAALLVEPSYMPPASMEALCGIYGELFHNADNEWLQRIAAAYQIAALTEGAQPELPAALPDANLEAFRQKLYGTGTPANVPKAELEQYLDIPTRDRITQLHVAIQGIEATHPGRPDRAGCSSSRGRRSRGSPPSPRAGA